ncbi:hypothetical protein N7495_008402 [Penicillium taxi]|uniref:uncharacterized protein n=1 Tax=Penicillium taxi TaxID=168475 RepID=UPI002545868F|nr:uncharacterized protein N7495_008402 [Penicillium taxi]KAJ5888361.1 hypothetical protein N7495_008402 [Penicillium taxi]
MTSPSNNTEPKNATSRPLIIPHKRPLLPPRTRNNSNPDGKPILKVLNPSAEPTETVMFQSMLYVDEGFEDEPDEPYEEIPRYETSFSMGPQPFLDPPVWKAMLKRAHAAATASEGGRGEKSGSSESLDARRQRQEREAEYGATAIRARSNISGRGRRWKGKGRGGLYSSGRS